MDQMELLVTKQIPDTTSFKGSINCEHVLIPSTSTHLWFRSKEWTLDLDCVLRVTHSSH